MNSIDKDVLKSAPINGLKVEKIYKNAAVETLLITLEKDHVFPEHTSPTEAFLVVVEGSIIFTIDGEEIHLKEKQVLNFSKEKKHHLKAVINSKILVIR